MTYILLDELHPFKQVKLDEEKFEIRRLVWILRTKRHTLPNSTTFSFIQELQNKQLEVMKKLGYKFNDLRVIARMYGCQLY